MMYRNATPQITPLKTTHGIRPLLGRCDDPNHRWWTGANRPRFTSVAYATALTKVRPPMCIPTDRVFHPVCKGVPDSNLVYPLSSILCLPPPAARSGRHRDFDRACPGKKRDHRVQTRPNRRRTAMRREASHTPTPPTPFKTLCAPFPWCHRLPWPHLPGGRATVPGHSEPLVDPPKGPHATKTYPFVPPMEWIGVATMPHTRSTRQSPTPTRPTVPPHPHHRPAAAPSPSCPVVDPPLPSGPR